MFIQSLSLGPLPSPVNSTLHTLLAISEGTVASLRSPFSKFTSSAFKRGCLAAGIVLAASLLCLSLSLPAKMIIPSDLLGGIHPASMDMLFASTQHSLTSVR